MIVTQDKALFRRMALLRSHGITKVPSDYVGASHGPWYHEQHELGFNYRMTDLQAALGTSQMNRMENFIAARTERADQYDAALTDLPLILPGRMDNAASAWHLYVIRLCPEETTMTRLELFQALREADIGVNVHYIPVHTQPDYRRFGFKAGDFPEAERYYAQAITLPLYPGLSEMDQHHITSTLKSLLQ